MAQASRFPGLRLRLPPGTVWFAVRTWIALAAALYAAFRLELDGASSAGVCVLILAQPQQGMVLSKAVYRFAATIVGVVVAVALTALFPQDRTMLLASFAVLMAAQTALGSIFRDFRSYACILAGYTVAIISITDIDAPAEAFFSAVNRVAAIALGVAAVALTNMVLRTPESSRSLMAKLRVATGDIVALALHTLDGRRRPDASTCIDLAARLMPLRGEITFAAPEKPNGRARAAGGRSALLGLFEAISAIQAVGAGLANLDRPSAVVDEAVAITRAAVRLQRPETRLVALEAVARTSLESGGLAMDEAYVLDRLMFLVETVGDIRDGLRALRCGWWPKRVVAIPVHVDWFAVLLNATRVLVAVGVVAALSVGSGIADTASAVLFTAVFVSLGAVQTDPGVMGRTALLGMPAVVLIGAAYAFLIFPLIDGFPLFILSLAPLVFAMCWFITAGLPGAGLIVGVQTVVLIAPANVQSLDPAAFVQTATMLTVSGLAIFLSFLLVLPVDPAQRRFRLTLAVGGALRRALADDKGRALPRLSMHYDRLAQFKTWQGRRAPTPARRATMTRLVDLGNLTVAVRRAWRWLDATRDGIAPALDAQARVVLPSLSPEITSALAAEYLHAARVRQAEVKQAEAKQADAKEARLDPQVLALVRAAAALYGTALATTSELRLLRRVNLLRRMIGARP